MESDEKGERPKNSPNGLCQPLQSVVLDNSSHDTRSNSQFSVQNVTAHGENTRLLEQAKGYLQKFPIASNLPIELQDIISNHLNPEVEITQNDYRKFASKLGFETFFINNLRGKSNPTDIVLQNCTDKKSVDLAQVLFDLQRIDVLSAIIEHGKKEGSIGTKRYPLPTNGSVQETVDSSSCSYKWSSFEEDSGYPSSLSATWPRGSQTASEFQSAMTRAPSEQDNAFGCEEDFHSSESKKFWESIPGKDYSERNWRDFEKELVKLCPDETQKGQVIKFLCHSLKVDYGKKDFDKMITVYDSPTSNKTSMYDLMNNSYSKRERKSWFAGHMTHCDAEKELSSADSGTFLVRFSESIEGFSLGMKTNHGVKHYQIKVDHETSMLKLGDQTFKNLHDFVKYGRDNPVDPSCNELLSVACKDLPLNVMFKGYDKPTAHNPKGVQGAESCSKGRARGRGRGKKR